MRSHRLLRISRYSAVAITTRGKRDAQEFAATVEVEKMSGQYVAPSLGMITVGAMAPTWLSRKQSDVAPSNYRTLESAWRIHVQPVGGQPDSPMSTLPPWRGG
jgi:hypothetical protein